MSCADDKAKTTNRDIDTTDTVELAHIQHFNLDKVKMLQSQKFLRTDPV